MGLILDVLCSIGKLQRADGLGKCFIGRWNASHHCRLAIASQTDWLLAFHCREEQILTCPRVCELTLNLCREYAGDLLCLSRLQWHCLERINSSELCQPSTSHYCFLHKPDWCSCSLPSVCQLHRSILLVQIPQDRPSSIFQPCRGHQPDSIPSRSCAITLNIWRTSFSPSSPCSRVLCSQIIMKIAWDLLERRFIFVEAVDRALLPLSINPKISVGLLTTLKSSSVSKIFPSLLATRCPVTYPFAQSLYENTSPGVLSDLKIGSLRLQEIWNTLKQDFSNTSLARAVNFTSL